jgi:thiosulfate dehydrogenase
MDRSATGISSGLCGVLAAIVLSGITSSAIAETPAARTWPFPVPNAATIPSGPLGDSIRFGEKVFSDTQGNAKAYVGNGLNCTSCHLNGGRTPYASPMVGIWGVFPEYRSRSARVEDLNDRINDCFLRSMNGKPPLAGGKLMVGLLSYMAWLSQGVPTGMSVAGRGFEDIALPAPAQVDAAKGKTLYAAKCSACHGVDGQGMAGANGAYLFPPLWGPKSFNVGAGMARLGNAAGFIKVNMPVGAGNTLSAEDAIDIAAYFTRQPRPAFTAGAADWPKGNKPADARN